MRVLAAMILIGALAGCAEVTRLHEPDGGDAYLIDCGSTMPRLESCRGAARRVCPAGYEALPATASGPSMDRPVQGVSEIRCTPAAAP